MSFLSIESVTVVFLISIAIIGVTLHKEYGRWTANRSATTTAIVSGIIVFAHEILQRLW